MLSKDEIKKWLLENCVDKKGKLDLSGLDFSDFDGTIDISGMKVKKNLLQSNQKIGGWLDQDRQEVGGNLYQNYLKVSGNLYQLWLEVKGYIDND